MRKRIFAVAALVAGAAGWAAAQELSPNRVLSWEDCVALARRGNPELLSARKAVGAGEARYRGSFNGLLPRVSLANRYSDSDGASGASRWQAEGTASLDLFNMENYAKIGGASAALRRAEADLRLRSAELRLGLRRAFAELLFVQEQVAVSEKVQDIRRQNAELVALKYDSGRESRGNMLRARAELLEAQALLAQSRRGLRVARQELGRELGSDGFEALVATGALDARSPPELPDAASLTARHPALLGRETAVALAKAGLKESRSSLWPSLTASVSRNWQGRDYFPSNAPGWSAGAVLSYPLFGAGPTAAYYKSGAAKRELEKAEADLGGVRNQLKVELESAWASLADKAEQLAVQRGFLDAARQRNEEASVRYSAGLMSFENWELVVAELVSSERGWVRARRDAVLAEAELAKARGLTLEE